MEYPIFIDANLAQILDQLCATMAAIVQEIKQQARHTSTEHTDNQWQNQTQPKQPQKLLNCGYREEDVDLDFKVEDHKELLAKIEDPSSLVNQVCSHSIHDKVNSLPHTDFSSPTWANTIAVEMFSANESSFSIAAKVFDKIPERMGYITDLNPDPPDGFDQFTHSLTTKQWDPANIMLIDNIENSDKMEVPMLYGIKLAPALLSMYAGGGDLSVARDMFDSLPTENVTIWNAMISAYTQDQKPEDAFVLCQKMLQDELQPNIITFVSIIPSYESFGSIWYGESLHACVIVKGFENELPVATVLISMCWVASLATFREMQFEGFNPDAVFIVSILYSCFKLGAVLLGKFGHAVSYKWGMDMNLNVSNGLLAFYSDCHDITSTFNLFHNMAIKNDVSWNTLISGFAHNGEDKQAISFLYQMHQEGIDLVSVTLISVLPCFSEAEDLVQGMVIHGYAVKKGLDSDVTLTNVLTSMYVNCGELDAEKLIFENLPNRSVVSWNALIIGYRHQSLRNEVMVLFGQMIGRIRNHIM